ncbi:hypothetical protein Pla123a_00380 [Posidoniimonas polymericola]|uniref:Autotransporter-associated beta strand repeat protein n=1 Tax=Posidoniimonas polymericola TaxID=2528002 RepID=A0A5C5ZD34_9BACT|nr:hypothetical protein [Posidoniimonas polymericola]TWT85232.1 hypothetical protein Pla123a_00380 [Posidoniimonas polymericola]
MISHRAFLPRSLYALAALLVAGAVAAPAQAQLTTSGQVYPSDNPFTSDFEGLYGFVNTFLDPATEDQEFWERDRNITIGEGSFGSVRLSQGGFLNFQHLVLGGSESDVEQSGAAGRSGPGNGAPEDGFEPGSPITGHGVLRIEDFNSFYNNHPGVIPSQYQDVYSGGSGNADQLLFNTTNTRADDVGFDAYIGLTGSGAMHVTAGGRAEIQDAVVVAYGANSTGYLEVSGLGSYLAAYGGLNPNATTIDRDMFVQDPGIHQMIIGAYGQGTMEITDGGYVDAFYGAAIGVTRSDGDDEITDGAFDRAGQPQGSGSVVVDGPGSTWNIMVTAFDGDMPVQSLSTQGGALAIGEFDESSSTPTYTDSELGRGYLSVRNDGLVRVQRYEEPTGSSAADDDADLRIGRMGTLDFRGGKVVVRDQLVSDGVIQAKYDGTGVEGGQSSSESILEVGTFENRYLGEVRIGAGQSLKVVATAEDNYTAPDAPEIFVAANYGLIEVVGDSQNGRAEFEFDREYAGSEITTLDPLSVRPNDVFFNAGETTAPGQIVAQDATLRFRNGLWNSGSIAFTGGDNTISGRVMNDSDAGIPRGSISITNGATVVFDDLVTNDGQITLTDDSNAQFLGRPIDPLMPVPTYRGVGELNIVSTGDVDVAGDFLLGDGSIGGTLRLYVEDFAADSYSHLVIEGDADFSLGSIEILGNIGPVTPGDAIDLITVLGTANFTGTVVSTLVATSPGIVLLTDTSGPALTLVAVSSIGALAGDFNGDGVVDAGDYTFYRDNIGGSELLLLGNGDGIGVIDAADLAIWRANYGAMLTLPAPVAALGAVPEPAGLALLASIALLGVRRRRA